MSKDLMTLKINRAVEEIERTRNHVAGGRMRQCYHFMPEAGWMNDPNGLIFYKGQYHFFFQFNPYAPFWGSMHWGHAVSRDLLHWHYLPPALAPSEIYDDHPDGGCFSGSAVEYEGKLWLIYTSVSDYGKGIRQTQSIAYSEDGIHFLKYDGNPVLEAPDGVNPGEFRDPKVWEHDGKFYMVTGASQNGRGKALLFSSDNLKEWRYVNEIAESRGDMGSMWECPDFYSAGDRFVLTFSPMGSGDHTSVYMTGAFDYKTGKLEAQTAREIDWGMDYYAAQSFLAPDGRRIVVGWANEWSWMPEWKDWGPTFKEGWCGFFNLPREVSVLEDGSLRFKPIRELESLRSDACCLDQISVSGRRKSLKAGNGISYEMKFIIDLDHSDGDVLELELRAGGGMKTICRFDFLRNELSVNRNNSDGWSRGISRSVMKLHRKSKMDVDIFSDQSSIEIFTDDYTNNHSNNVFAGEDQRDIFIRAEGGSFLIRNFESYGMQSCYDAARENL
ncbi:MAG: glycoside hydrolase family 32 protein [Eubacterium sp.]|nr:glycoside hydrolase family 32 protein [Eubacterium sp.]